MYKYRVTGIKSITLMIDSFIKFPRFHKCPTHIETIYVLYIISIYCQAPAGGSLIIFSTFFLACIVFSQLVNTTTPAQSIAGYVIYSFPACFWVKNSGKSV